MNQKLHDDIEKSKLHVHEDLEMTKTQVHEQIAEAKAQVTHDVDVIRHESIKTTFTNIFSLTEDVASHVEIRTRILDGGKFTGTNMIVLILAILIASIGLNTNSTAVIIGAMLISPLMGNILAMAYGTASADKHVVAQFAVGYIVKIIISVATSAIYFSLSPIKEVTTELLARTNPRFFDVLIAICGGLAGIVGQTRKDKANNIIPGVAIATALMPPLCTCGYAIANGRWTMFLGAGYLFIVNSYFIFLSSTWILSILQVPHVANLSDKEWKSIRLRMFRNALVITLPTVIAGIIALID